jgi:hypothetical protein
MEEDKDKDKVGMTHTVHRHLDLPVIREMEHQKAFTLLRRLPLVALYPLVQDGHRSTQPQLRKMVFHALAAVPK